MTTELASEEIKTQQMYRKWGLSDDEFLKIQQILTRYLILLKRDYLRPCGVSTALIKILNHY